MDYGQIWRRTERKTKTQTLVSKRAKSKIKQITDSRILTLRDGVHFEQLREGGKNINLMKRREIWFTNSVIGGYWLESDVRVPSIAYASKTVRLLDWVAIRHLLTCTPLLVVSRPRNAALNGNLGSVIYSHRWILIAHPSDEIIDTSFPSSGVSSDIG